MSKIIYNLHNPVMFKGKKYTTFNELIKIVKTEEEVFKLGKQLTFDEACGLEDYYVMKIVFGQKTKFDMSEEEMLENMRISEENRKKKMDTYYDNIIKNKIKISYFK